jgi:hypothetical protein
MNTARTIYEMTMIFASCCLGLVLFVFVVCILKKAYCSPRTSRRPNGTQMESGPLHDMFGLCAEAHHGASSAGNDQFFPYSINVPFEKPPTYEETLRIMRGEIGVPPPAYEGTASPTDPNRSATASVGAMDSSSGATGSSEESSGRRMILAGDTAFTIASGRRGTLNRSISSPLVSNLVRYQNERYEPRPLQGHDNGAFMRE